MLQLLNSMNFEASRRCCCCCCLYVPLILLLLQLYILLSKAASLDTGCHPDFYCEPDCIDRPEGYFCNCGPGFIWNSYSCVSEAVDSKLLFSSRQNASYAVINNRIKIPAKLKNFTVSVFMKLKYITEDGTVFSYRREGYGSVASLRYDAKLRSLVIQSCADTATLSPKYEMIIDIGDQLPDEWLHFAWTSQQLNPSSTMWNAFVTSAKSGSHRFNRTISAGVVLPGQVEIYLGQSAPDQDNQFDLAHAFIGEIAHFNVWNFSFSYDQIDQVFTDCLHQFCGSEVEWSDFRYGTRGNVSLSWPSGILFGNKCTNVSNLQQSCDLKCSLRMGAQCKAGIDSNIQWPRTKADSRAEVACPNAFLQPVNVSESVMAPRSESSVAHRSCSMNDRKQGEWEQPNFLSCVGAQHQDIRNELSTLHHKRMACNLFFNDRLRLLQKMKNISDSNVYDNPMDLHVMIEALENITLTWKNAIHCADYNRDLSDLKLFFNTVLALTDNLMSLSNEVAWNFTRPPGQECWHLLAAVHSAFSQIVADLHSLHSAAIHVGQSVELPDMFMMFNGENIVVKLTAFDPSNFNGDALPDKEDEKRLAASLLHLGAVGVSADAADHEIEKNRILTDKIIFSILALYPHGNWLLPHIHLKSDWKRNIGTVPRIEDNVNSAVYHSLLFVNSSELTVVAAPIRSKLRFANNVNISDVNCVRLAFHDPTSTHWTRKGCWLESKTDGHVKCACNATGLIAVTSDMYNDDLKRNNHTLRLLAYPSYIGCAVSSVLCMLTCVLLVYFRTSTNTAKIHQHFSLAISCGQLAFIVGIDQTWDPTLCHWMSLSIHYFYLTSFCWLMNEAFNLYIVITYAAHAHQHGSEEGGMWRYYLIGWIFPIALVGAFRGINGKTYFAKNMCWTSSVWLYAGPAISIVAITMMVLVFTAKEHHESSYTKDEKSNRAIAIHAKALWSQVILLSVAWSFAFVSIAMQDIIVKLLFAMFNCLQGIFFLVFYFLLNEEVQNKYVERQKQRLIALQDLQGEQEGVEADQHSDSRCAETSGESVEASSGRQRRRVRRRSCHSQRLDSAEDNSDCEMIVTSV